MACKAMGETQSFFFPSLSPPSCFTLLLFAIFYSHLLLSFSGLLACLVLVSVWWHSVWHIFCLIPLLNGAFSNLYLCLAICLVSYMYGAFSFRHIFCLVSFMSGAFSVDVFHSGSFSVLYLFLHGAFSI